MKSSLRADVQVSDHAERDAASGRTQSSQEPKADDGTEVGRECARNLPDIHEEQTDLQDRPSTNLLAPRSPELATESVGHQIDHLTYANTLLADAQEMFRERDGGWVRHWC